MDRPTFQCLRCGLRVDSGPGATFESTVAVAAAHRCPTLAPRKWEYLTAEPGEDWNALGAEGWELVTVNHQTGTAYFKRPIVEG